MLKRILLPGLVVLIGAQAPVPASAPPVTPAAIDALVHAYREATGVPGVAVAVTRGDHIVHAAGYGNTAAGEPVTARTRMALASVSKSMTALAVLQLVEEGRVRLDEPARSYLPEFTMADPRAGAITVRQLLDQTSGMSDTTFRYHDGPPVGTLRETVVRMRSARLAAAPGTRWEYHNGNYSVAARLVEVVGGRPFTDHLRQRLFDPLGMADSRTGNISPGLPSSARGHLVVLGTAVALPEPRAPGNGSGGVASSARDMAAWLITQHRGGRGPDGTVVASPAAIAAMHRPSVVSGSYGMGWFVGTTASGAPVIDHGGDLFTATAYQALLPASGHGVAVMANTGALHGDAQAIGDQLVALLEGRSVPPASTPLVWIDAALLVLAAGAGLLAGRGVRRSRRWAAGRTMNTATAARLLALLLPLALCATIRRLVTLLWRRDFSWLQVGYLYPTFMVLLATVTLGCLVVLLARLVALRTRRP